MSNSRVILRFSGKFETFLVQASLSNEGPHLILFYPYKRKGDNRRMHVINLKNAPYVPLKRCFSVILKPLHVDEMECNAKKSYPEGKNQTKQKRTGLNSSFHVVNSNSNLGGLRPVVHLLLSRFYLDILLILSG